jgi:hypothetical protein
VAAVLLLSGRQSRAQKHRVMLFLLLLTSRLMMPPFSINKENRYN